MGHCRRPDDKIDVVLAVAIECRAVGESGHRAIEAHVRHPTLGRLSQHLSMKPLTTPHHGRQ